MAQITLDAEHQLISPYLFIDAHYHFKMIDNCHTRTPAMSFDVISLVTCDLAFFSLDSWGLLPTKSCGSIWFRTDNDELVLSDGLEISPDDRSPKLLLRSQCLFEDRHDIKALIII